MVLRGRETPEVILDLSLNRLGATVRALSWMVWLALCGALFISVQSFGQSTSKRAASMSFAWPEGKRAAVSLSFDDARLSQIDTGLTVLKKKGVKVTFFVQPGGVEQRLAGWKQAVADGHEIANHTRTHPCTGNYEFSRNNALENYDLAKIAQEIDGASQEIYQQLGVKPRTFAYPCGQKFVGRGADVKSYVPLVAQRFVAGRGIWMSRPTIR
jgi:peptidoglycan-N-acetylglucosamine deacetylase